MIKGLFVVFALLFSLNSNASGHCSSGDASCSGDGLTESCAGGGICYFREKLWSGNYKCACEAGRPGGNCKSGSNLCMNDAPGTSCGFGDCLPIGSTWTGDYECVCE